MTAGILPATRTRRAAFLLNLPSRVTAVTSSVLAIASLYLSGTAFGRSLLCRLVKERAHARLHVNVLDCRAEETRNRQHLDLLHRFRLFAQWNGIRHDQFLDPRTGDALDRRSGEHRMRRAGVDLDSPHIQEGVRCLYQCPGRI